jgi:NADH-quinone oxidoreductase subunit L
MHDELHELTDIQVTLSSGDYLRRPGRYHRFFQYLSLFSFSMLGLVIAGNLFMVFIFWELVGICSYFLIGFYIERKTASNAANKAFIVNRVGDFGMLIGLMALWASLGTFTFGDSTNADGNLVETGIFSRVRPAESHHQLTVPDGMIRLAKKDAVAEIAATHATQQLPGDAAALAATRAAAEEQIQSQVGAWRTEKSHPGYWLLVVAGIGIFCGCVGKSAQFPLHVWLPDAMEGPTPVSALVHSATMVAAGVYLVGRFYPVFAPEVLLVIAAIGCFTLFMAATIALVATDIKRVLAYSTLSQLGYMMFALGIGGWLAGMLHLITHAFFKSLLFLCSGSVIHAVHSNEMTDMGGLLKKMPITAWTMLIGCLAIAGAGIPTIIGLSGYYSKDAIIAQGLYFREHNALWGALTLVAVAGAALTAFYMFRLWFMTFLGKPRDHHRYDHAHESPRVMTAPLVLLAFFAVFVATPPITTLLDPASSYLVRLLEQARPAGTGVTMPGLVASVVVPDEHGSHAHNIHLAAGLIAFATAAAGVLVACVIYWWQKLDPNEVRQQFRPVHRFLWNKWWFDELYDAIFVRPTHFIARRIAAFDRGVIDWLIDGSARVCRVFASLWDLIVDRGAVDGSLNTLAKKTWDAGLALRRVQTGQLRMYVMSIVIGTILLFVAISAYWSLVAST